MRTSFALLSAALPLAFSTCGGPSSRPQEPSLSQTVTAAGGSTAAPGLEPSRTPAPAPAGSPAPAQAVSRAVSFADDVAPILARCQPCHFPGGKVYEKLPFDRPETVRLLGTKLFSRIKDEGEQQVIRTFLAQTP